MRWERVRMACRSLSVPRLGVLLFAAFAMALFVWPRLASAGGTSIASAPVVAPGQQEAGNTDVSQIPYGGCPQPDYADFWKISLTAGDTATFDWSSASNSVDALDILPAGTTDGDLANASPLDTYFTSSQHSASFSAESTGVYPFDFNAGCYNRDTPGPYTFVVTVTGPSSAPASPCTPVHGGLGKRLLASLKCTAVQTKLEAECAFGVASLIFLPLKSLKLVEAAKSIDVIDKLPAKLQPAAEFIWDLSHAHYSRYAPPGFRTGAQAVQTVSRVDKAYQLLKLLPDIVKAVSNKDFSQIALDLDAIAGLRPCVQGVANALDS